MAKKNKYDISDLDGLKKMFDDSVEELSREVLREIEEAYEIAIYRFYEDYDPLYYRRTESTMYASSGFPMGNELFEPQNFQKISGGYNVGITVDSSHIPGNPYRANKHWVFERTFKRGIHGINTKTYKGISSKTFTRYTGSFKRTFKLEFIDRTMSNMVPAPQALMNNQFKAITRKRKLKSMFNEILTKKL